jgi:hypothetical protein
MKDLDKIETPESDRIIISQDIKKTIKFIGSQDKVKGLTMFEFNPLDMTLVPAVYKETAISYPGTGSKRGIEKLGKVVSKLIYKDDCIYVQALNKKTAFKKIAKTYRDFK